MSADEVKEQEATTAETETKDGDDNTIEVTLPELTKPLERMTVKELKEIGLLVPTLVGVHGMKKDELVTALKEVYGIEDEVKAVAVASDVKKQIKALQAEKDQAREAGDRHRVDMLRRRISRMKKKTRSMAKAAKAAAAAAA